MDAQSPGQFVAADPVLRVDQQPDRREPFVESERAVLEDSALLDAVLVATRFAFPELSGGQVGVLVAATARAARPIGPAEGSGEECARSSSAK